MAETLRLEIVTPQAVVFSEHADMVTFPGVEGQMGVYPQHVPLITMIVPGERPRAFSSSPASASEMWFVGSSSSTRSGSAAIRIARPSRRR